MRRRIGATLSRLLLSAPEPCYGQRWDYHQQHAIGWNLYRCKSCAARRWPERLYHWLVWRLTRGLYDPFGRGRL